MTLSVKEREAIKRLLDANIGIKEIAKRLGRSVGTIHNYKQLMNAQAPQDSQDISASLAPFEKVIAASKEKNVSKLLTELQQSGYKGSYATLARYVRLKKQAQPLKDESLKPYKPAIRIETPPGEQAQVDWGTFGTVHINGRKEKLHAFVYILSYSRMMYVEFTVRQNQQTLQQCHINAFKALGIPRIIRYDNMKTVVISHKRQFGEKPTIHYNPSFLDFARYYDFIVEACPPYWPRAKGKVEASVKYVRHSFIDGTKIGRQFASLEIINNQVERWLDTVAHRRIHRTTGTTPYALYKTEKAHLHFVADLPDYVCIPPETRRSTKDGMVAYKSNFYSIPQHLAGKKMSINEINEHGITYIEIYYRYERIARHEKAIGSGHWVIEENHSLEKQPNERTATQEVKSVKQPYHKRPNVDVEIRSLSYYDHLTKGG